MDYSRMMRAGAGLAGGFGKGLMDPDFRSRFEEGQSGGFQDLMQAQRNSDYVEGGLPPELEERAQNLRARMRRGVPIGVPGTGATGYRR